MSSSTMMRQANIKQEHDDDDDDRKPAAVPPSIGTSGEAGKKRKVPNDDDEEDDDDDDEEQPVVIPAPTLRTAVATSAASPRTSNDDDEGEEVQLLHSTGPTALADFPHAREHCLLKPMQQDPTARCPNCYCYVCDAPASDCTEWENSSNHCHAKSTDPHWRKQRQEKKVQKAGTAIAVQSPSYMRYNVVTVKELLAAVTRIYPSERSPPANSAFSTQLKHYQKQSLAFMMDIEQTYPIKSGFLCSEVGMGKSAVVIALIVSNPMPQPHPSEEDCKNARFQKTVVSVKGTIIFTSKSLMGQWEDEIKKHAPQLVTHRHHGTSKLKLADLAHADVIISAPTVEWTNVYQNCFKYHRVVLDESHLLGTVSARQSVVCSLATDRSWCITATPMTSSTSDLKKQLSFLALEQEYNRSDNIVEFVKRYMLRHLKSQLISGSAALTLPKTTTKVRKVKMTEWERQTFEDALEKKGQRSLYSWYGGSDTKIIEMRWFFALMKPLTCEDSSKIVRLKADLYNLRRKEPNMRAVVFTQLREQHRFACMAIKAMKGVKMYRFDGSATSAYRDKAIREFQDTSTSATAGPAVFLITMKAGSVGLTLTAASHVFLLEPCIDPTHEVQAAGRIHRLGQTKQVGVTKYYFDDCCESNILKLHEKIEEGTIEFTSGTLSGAALSALRVQR